MTTRPRVSIIMAAYNAAATLAASIGSVQAQTFGSWELIVVDDGSTDRTAAMVEALATEDSRIRLERQHNSGPSVARNRGLGLARAETIAFLDADDTWAPARVAGMLRAFAGQPDSGVLFSRTRFLDADTGLPGTLTPHFSELTAASLLAENAVCSTSNIMARRDVFRDCGVFLEGLNFAEDQDWLVRVALNGKWKIRGVDREWFFYRSCENSQSADLEAMRAGWTRLVAHARKQAPKTVRAAERAAFAPFHRQLARRALRLGRPLLALKYLGIGLSRDPGLLLRQPRRTALTALGALIALIPNAALKELVAR